MDENMIGRKFKMNEKVRKEWIETEIVVVDFDGSLYTAKVTFSDKQKIGHEIYWPEEHFYNYAKEIYSSEVLRIFLEE